MPKRSRIVVLFALPASLFLWLVGWSLYWIGGKKENVKPKTVSKANDLTFTVLTTKEKIEA